MAKFEEFQLDGCISFNGEEMDETKFMNAFLELIESKGWFYGGGINGYRKE